LRGDFIEFFRELLTVEHITDNDNFAEGDWVCAASSGRGAAKKILIILSKKKDDCDLFNMKYVR